MGPCVIIMRGLPINVTVQDIVNYFSGFPEVGPLKTNVLLDDNDNDNNNYDDSYDCGYIDNYDNCYFEIKFENPSRE